MNEYKIGETFECEGKVLEVKAGRCSSCRKCVFDNDINCQNYMCTPAGREDRKWVYFVEVKPKEVKSKKTNTKKVETKKVKSPKVKTKEVKNG